MKRPLWVIGHILLIALLMLPIIGINGCFVLTALAVLGTAIFLLIPRLKRRSLLVACSATVAAACVLFIGAELIRFRPALAFDGQTVELTGTVTELTESGCIIHAVGDPLPKGTAVQLYFNTEEAVPELYGTVRGTFTLFRYRSQGIWEFCNKSYGIFLGGISEYDHPPTLEPPVDRPRTAVFSDIRQALSETLTRRLGPSLGPMMSKMLLGIADDLDPAITADFRAVGLSHLLAVSGLHLSILCGSLFIGLSRIRRIKRIAPFITAPFVLFFMALAGFSPSIVRAGVMYLIVLLACGISREADALNSLGLSLIVLLITDPFAAYDPGLLLSFSATLGLLKLYPPLYKCAENISIRPIRHVADSLFITLSALGATLPISVVLFGTLPLIAPISNLLLVFPASIALILTAITLPLSLLPIAGILKPLWFFCGLFARLVRDVTDWLADIPFACISVAAPYLLIGIIGGIALIIFGFRRNGATGLRRYGAIAVSIILCGVLTHSLLMRHTAQITALPTDGDTAVLIEQDGHTVLVVSAKDSDVWYTVLSALRERGIQQIDLIVAANASPGLVYAKPTLGDLVRETVLILPPDPPASLSALNEQFSAIHHTDTASFGRHWSIERAGGFVHVVGGQTRILIGTADADASAVPANWRYTHLAVFSGRPPLFAASIQAQAVLWQVDERDQPFIWTMSCPVRFTANYTAVTAITRCEGDIALG